MWHYANTSLVLSSTMAVIIGQAEFWEYKFHPCIHPHRDADKPAVSHEGGGHSLMKGHNAAVKMLCVRGWS